MMTSDAIGPLSSILLVITFAGAVYLAIAVYRLAAFARRPLELASEFLPAVTVLKPIAGLEPNLYENLASFCNQDYEQRYDVIFCLHSRTDPAFAVVERLAGEFSEHTSIVIGETALGNPKIANLAKPGVELRGEIVIVADSDIHVGRDYLRALAAAFASQRIGAATCLYSGVPNRSLVARLGALHIDDGFFPSVLVALAIGKLPFFLGATMAVRRRILEEIGGLEALGPYLADDHRLGELVAQRGYEIELSRYIVQTTVTETNVRALWSHELRWARTNLALAPAGYLFSFLMYALPFALLYVAVSRDLAWGLPLLAAVVGLRLAVHYIAGKALHVTRHADVWLIPLRDFASLAVWGASLFGRTVLWRKKKYRA
jgi:ceramide glucosyltransferase